MPQNIYDNPDFFRGYKELRDKQAGLNEVLEQPALLSLLPEMGGLSVLDLGCGAGGLCRRLKSLGALAVLGVDISSKMLELAKMDTPGGVEFLNKPMEELDFRLGAFDLVVSSLAFHYVADLAVLFQKINGWLKPFGVLLFSMEHPIATCSQGIHQGWITGNTGDRVCWPVDDYYREGKRESRWFVEGVIKYHRTVSTILNNLIETGFTIQAVKEPVASEEAEQNRPSLKDERRRPPFLIVKAVKAVS
jgi:SAM-dependent methyltransferase